MKDKIVNDCSITGFRLTTHQKWTNAAFSPEHSTSFTIIEKNILLCESIGFVRLEGLKKSLNLSFKIIKENFEDKPFIYVEDFSKVTSIGVEGRKYYIKYLKGLKNLKALVYYNVNPFLSLSIKLAQKLNLTNFDIFVAKSYKDAADLAFNFLNSKNKAEYLRQKRGKIKTHPDWRLEFDDFSVRYEIVNGNIFHVISKGTLSAEHMDSVFEFQEKLIEKNLLHKSGNYYFVADLNNFELARDCRKLYGKKIQSLYNKFPFKVYIYYGASRLINIIITMGSTLINIDTKNEKNFKSVLSFVKKKEQRKEKKLKKKKRGKQIISGETRRYIDEFLFFLGKIDWEGGGTEKNLEKDTSHPFYQVYDAITLIKSDLDELYLERKKNEEERLVLQNKLQQSLKLETMGKLAGSVAHDLNNVLSGIVSYPDIILNELPLNKENEKAVKYIKRMKKSGQKAADIVQDLLTLSRSGVVNFEVLNINSIIEDYLKSPELVKLKSINSKISIKCRLSENLNNISASSIHLTKTIMNLVTNAVEAISDQGIIKITTKNISFKNIKFKGYDQKADGDFIELIVSDTGSGISDQDLPKIFEPFYSKKVMGRSGTGLGMLVIKGTVDDHNGFIIINSEEKKGTEFILYFPVKEEGANKKFVQKIDNYTGSGESILIIDDDEDQRIIAYKILKELHYSVKTVASGEEAIEFLKNKKFDLIVLDMIMEPGIGGLETYKQARNINPNQKAVIVSGYSATNHVAEAQKLGAGQYIRKPYTIEDIGIAVFNELKKK